MDTIQSVEKRQRRQKSVIFDSTTKKHDGITKERHMYIELLSNIITGKIVFKNHIELVLFCEQHNNYDAHMTLNLLEKVTYLIDDLIDLIKFSEKSIRVLSRGGSRIIVNTDHIICLESLRNLLADTIMIGKNLIKQIIEEV